MGFESILDLKEPVKGVTRPAFFQDLNIDQILERITKGDRDILRYFEYFPLDEECEGYRLENYRDIKDNKLFGALTDFVSEYNEYRDIEQKKKSTRIQMQKPVWHFCGMEIYTRSLAELKEALAEAGLKSQGFSELRKMLEEYTTQPEFNDMALKSKTLKEALDGLDVIVRYEKGRLIVSVERGDHEDGEASKEQIGIDENAPGADEVEYTAEEYDEEEEENGYEDFLSKICPVNEKEFVNPFANTHELTNFEQEIIKIVAKRNPDIFKEASRLYDETREYENKIFSRFADEIRFYLSFYEFEEKLEKSGFTLCSPCRGEQDEFEAEELYDLALACVNIEKDKPVIRNDFSYDRKEMFFVLTGPNQGGKTTFARSMGQLVYFTKIGLFTPARKAVVPWFADILTHFSVEESVETGRGKLMEELVRLAPMMKEKNDNVFVVINELFTTAANYDAIIMGKNVLKHFLDEGRCHGIYVTHLKELCEGDARIAGLSAQLDENGIQNFKIQKKSVDYVGCAKNQVEKFGLSYDKLKQRLKERFGTLQ